MNVAARYPAYADTRSDALGPLPETWSATQLKRVVDECRQITYGIVQAGPNVEGGVPYVRPADMHDEAGVRDLQNLLRTSEAIASNYRRSAIASGDLVCSIGPSFGKVMVVPEGLTGGNLTQGTARVAISHKNSARFFFWALRSPEAFQQWESSVGGATFRALNLGPLAETRLPLPPLEEQTQIANFLDYETAKIDALIEKQQQLIRLLKEKRQAVISHAVTKGLNPDAPMRDSGVEWLGKVPAHWTVGRIKYVAQLESGHTPSRKVEEYWVDCTIPWVSLNDTRQLKTADYISDTAVRISERGMANSSAHKLPPGCVVFTRDATIGLAAITSRVMAVSQHIIAWVCDPAKVSSEYLLLIFYAMEAELERFTFGATLRTIGMPDVKRLTGVFPPLDEQADIVRHVFDTRGKLTRSIEKAEEMSGLLQERRTALISAAVTGKIDVRGWTPPESATEQEVA